MPNRTKANVVADEQLNRADILALKMLLPGDATRTIKIFFIVIIAAIAIITRMVKCDYTRQYLKRLADFCWRSVPTRRDVNASPAFLHLVIR
jgi:hypothetical protein